MFHQNSIKRNEWTVPPDNTIQVVDPNGITQPIVLERDWAGIWIALAIITGVCSLIAIAAALVVPFDANRFKGRSLQIGDLGDSDTIQSYSPLQWITDNEVFYSSKSEGLLILNVETKKSKRILPNIILSQTQSSKFFLSPDKKFILLEHDVVRERIFTQTARYSIYDIINDLFFALKLGEHDRFEYVDWCGGAQSNDSAMIVLLQDDIYFFSSPHQQYLRLTKSGAHKDISNGYPDLLYEEILKRKSAIWSNPSGKFLAVATFNAKGVKAVPKLKYDAERNLFVDYFRYATVVTAIPTWKLVIYDLGSLKMDKKLKFNLVLPFKRTSRYYLLGLGWIDDNGLWVSYMSRDQSLVELCTCAISTRNCTVVYSKERPGSRMPLLQNIAWDGSWAAFAWPVVDRNGVHQNSIIVVKNQGEKSPSIVENHAISKLIDYSRTTNSVLFLGSEQYSVNFEHHIYIMSLNDNVVTCITCDISSDCFSAHPSPNRVYVIVRCKSLLSSHFHILNLQQHTHLITLNSGEIRSRWNPVEISLPMNIYEKMHFPGELEVSVHLKLPPYWTQFDEPGSYPVVLEVVQLEDTGRGFENEVTWSDILVSKHRVVHSSIRIEETSFHEFISVDLYASFVSVAVSRLFEKYGTLNKNAIFGWGRGSGGSSVLLLSNNEEADFKLPCVAAINPIYDWTQYSSFWSERILGPKIKPDGRGNYGKSHLSTATPSLKNSLIMLVQDREGLSSEHSYKFAESLIKENIHFKHVLYSGNKLRAHVESRHLAQSLLDFFLQNQCIGGFLIEDS